jgi:copper chaperone
MCQAHKQTDAQNAVPAGAVSVRVEDMTCGHCAKTITSAIESAIPGAKVVANPGAKLVSVHGADVARVRALIAEAGYTPSA